MADKHFVSSDLKAILGLEVPLIVLLGERHMKLREITSLIPGAIIELQKLADEELEVLVNNKPVGTGMPVKVGENFGVRISYIGDLRERIRALGALEEEGLPEEVVGAAGAGAGAVGGAGGAEPAMAERA